jgi:hypothetical protein
MLPTAQFPSASLKKLVGQKSLKNIAGAGMPL